MTRPDLYEKGWQVYPFQVTDAEYDAFMALLTAYRTVNPTSLFRKKE